jgi:hypothetical protein
MGRLTFQCLGLTYFSYVDYAVACSWILHLSAANTREGVGARILWEAE